jgi:hypothetical protein
LMPACGDAPHQRHEEVPQRKVDVDDFENLQLGALQPEVASGSHEPVDNPYFRSLQWSDLQRGRYQPTFVIAHFTCCGPSG